jgi:2-aminomuconate deaminase
MWNDPIVEEVRQARLQIEAECDFDVEKIYARMLEAQKANPRPLITQPLSREKKWKEYKSKEAVELPLIAEQQERYSLQFQPQHQNVIISSQAPEPVGPYPHAHRVGNLLFLSGVGPRERGSKKIPGVELDETGNIISYDIAAQCHSVFRNIKYILEEAGSSWDKIVDVTVFLTNLEADFPTFNRIYAEYFQKNQPCRTTVEVNRLPTPIAIELKVIATTKEHERGID